MCLVMMTVMPMAMILVPSDTSEKGRVGRARESTTGKRATYQLVHTGSIITSANDAGPPRGLVHDGDCLAGLYPAEMGRDKIKQIRCRSAPWGLREEAEIFQAALAPPCNGVTESCDDGRLVPSDSDGVELRSRSGGI